MGYCIFMIDAYRKNSYMFKLGFSYLLLTYIFIPLILTYFGNGYVTNLEYNFFSFPAYTLILVFFFIVFNRKTLLEYSHKPSFTHFVVWTFIAVFFFHLYVHFRFSPFFTYSNVDTYLLVSWTFYLFGTVAHALSMFGYPLFKKTANSLVLFTFMVYFFYIVTKILWQLWDFLAQIVARGVFFLLSIFSSTAFFEHGTDPRLGLGDFSVIVGPPCSGIDSLSMFLGLFILFVIYEGKNISFKRAMVVLILGLFGTYLINVLRVSLLILIGTKYPSFALGSFHSQAGWIFFSFFVLIILYFSYGWMKSKKGNE